MDKKLYYLLLVFLFIFGFIIYTQSNYIKQLSKNNEELTQKLKSTNSYYSKQFEEVQKANEILQLKLSSIESNECGKEQVPQYLLDAERDLLKGI